MKLPNNTTSNTELQQALEQAGGPKVGPLTGIYYRDELPALSPGSGAILNLDPSSEGLNNGTHWTALIRPVSGGRYLYMDPFGIMPPESVPKNTTSSKKQIQPIDSTSCGWYVLDFLLNVSTAAEMRKWLTRWQTGENVAKNEAKIEKIKSDLV